MLNHVVAPIKLPISDSLPYGPKKNPIRRRYAPIIDIWPDLYWLLALNSALTIVVSVPAACLSIHWYSSFIHKTEK